MHGLPEGSLNHPFPTINKVGAARKEYLSILAPKNFGNAALGVNGQGSFSLIGKSAKNGGRAGASARCGRFTGTAFPNADLNIFPIQDFYEDDIGPLGKRVMYFKLFTQASPIEIEIIDEGTRRRISYIHGRDI